MAKKSVMKCDGVDGVNGVNGNGRANGVNGVKGTNGHANGFSSSADTAQKPIGDVKADGNAFNAGKTDPKRWRMLDVDGRQTWHYLETDEQMKEWPQSFADKYYLDMRPLVCLSTNTV